MGPWKRAAPAFLAVVAAFVAPISASAQEPNDPTPAKAEIEQVLNPRFLVEAPPVLQDAVLSLLDIIVVLTEFDLFEPSEDPAIQSILIQINAEADDEFFADEDLRPEMVFFSYNWPDIIQDLESEGFSPSANLLAIEQAVSKPSFLEQTETPESIPSPEVWVSALVDLLIRDGQGPQIGEEIDEQAVILDLLDQMSRFDGGYQEPGFSDGFSVEEQANSSGPLDSGGLGLPLSVGVLGGVVALCGAFLIGRQHRGREKDFPTSLAPVDSDPVSLEDLLEASRRMTSSLDISEVAQIALTEAQRLVGAEGGIFVLRNDGKLQVIGMSSSSLFRSDALQESHLRRVVETGQASASVAKDDPLVIELPTSAVSVPIIADGMVIGALMVIRVPNEPFARSDIQALELLAPLAGSAVQAAAAHGSATQLSFTEPLTGLKNRRCLDRDMSALTPESSLSYLMIDIDHFKAYNDANGHTAGDNALRAVAGVLSESVRPGDSVYRYGGEEFCVLLPEATTSDAAAIAERIRRSIETAEIPGIESQPNGRLTVSIGGADIQSGKLQDLIERADLALYRAKKDGRNLVRLEV